MSLHLTNVVNSRIGRNAWASMHSNFDDYGDVRVLVVWCEKSRVPIYVKGGNSEQFFVRTGPATTALAPSQTQEYIMQRFN